MGAGTLGLPIVSTLAVQNVSVLLLSRPGSSTKNVPSGVDTVQLDYNNVTAVVEVLTKYGVDVVLSTVNNAGLLGQTALVDAAKLADVKLLLPSEYGVPTDGQPDGVDSHLAGIETKNQIAGTNICSSFRIERSRFGRVLEISQPAINQDFCALLSLIRPSFRQLTISPDGSVHGIYPLACQIS